LGYGNPKSLSDASVRNCSGDIKDFKPSIMVGVPTVWETVKKGIVAKVNSGSAPARHFFCGAMWAKSHLVDMGLPGSGLLDAVVFRKPKEAIDCRLKFCMSVGGPIAETQQFISTAICLMIIGYGLTESTAQACMMNPAEWSSKTIGAMPASVEVKLVYYADAGYRVTNKPNPQGKMWIRGTGVIDGYYQNNKETAETITSDGWLKTGDIGEFDSRGHVKLIDRKKNLIKMLNGEYIALEKLESVYRSNDEWTPRNVSF
jgi:long-chain acyl-CoA synthetase